MKITETGYDRFVEIHSGNGQPEISILFPIYRREQYVVESISSVLAQRGVVAEIIISDDASPDGSFENVINAVISWIGHQGTNHKIVVRRGSKRLRRDHIHLMAEYAGCDLLCQAHDDDESHPDRARLTVEAFSVFPHMHLMGVECDLMDMHSRLLGEKREINYPISVDLCPLEATLTPNDQYLIGACLAWRRSALQSFDRLDSGFAATCHDWILVFRAALIGEVRIARAPLIKRRIHDSSWSSTMVRASDAASVNFGWSLQHLSSYCAKRCDLEKALKMGFVNEERYRAIANALELESNRSLSEVMEAYKKLTRDGWVPSWIRD